MTKLGCAMKVLMPHCRPLTQGRGLLDEQAELPGKLQAVVSGHLRRGAEAEF